MIPRRASWYWGSSPLSWSRFRTLETFRKYNPDWEMVLYRGKTVVGEWTTVEVQDNTSYSGFDYMEQVPALCVELRDVAELGLPKGLSDVHASDMMAWKVLSNQGGVVSDMDIVWQKSLGALDIMTDVNATVGLTCFDGLPKAGYIPVTMMMSAGASQFFDSVYQRACLAYDPEVYESCGTPNLGAWGDIVPSCLGLRRLPDDVLYPYYSVPDSANIIHVSGMGSRYTPSPGSIGLHWYAGSPCAQRTNCAMTKSNASSVDTIFAEAVRSA